MIVYNEMPLRFNKCACSKRWRPGHHKWRPEINIFSLSGPWLDKFLQRELKQRHWTWDLLCETEPFHQVRHRTSGCYSWRPGGQPSHSLSSLKPRANGQTSVCTWLWQVSNFAQQLPTKCKNMQQGVETDATCNIQQCCVICMGLNMYNQELKSFINWSPHCFYSQNI